MKTCHFKVSELVLLEWGHQMIRTFKNTLKCDMHFKLLNAFIENAKIDIYIYNKYWGLFVLSTTHFKTGLKIIKG
jgi:hypothetical protein